MRRLVVPIFLGAILSLSPSAFATPLEDLRNDTLCNSPTDDPGANVDGWKSRCTAVQNEAMNQLKPNAYGTPWDWNAGGAATAANAQAKADALVQKLNNLKSQAAKCCGTGGGCPVQGQQPGSIPASGDPMFYCTHASNMRFQGNNSAFRSGTCAADKKICTDYVNNAKTTASASGLTPDFSNADAVCASMSVGPTSDINDSFNAAAADDISNQSVNSGKLCSTDPNKDPKDPTDPKGGGGGPKGGGDSTNSGTPSKSAGKGGGGMNPMSMLGPLMQMAQQAMQPKDNNQDQQQPPALQQTPCGPGIVNGGQPCTPAAATAASDSFNKNTGTSSFQTASTKNAGFNPGDATTTPGTGKSNPSFADTSNQQPLGTTQVPNGGGQMPGGQQGGGGGATLGGGGGGGAVQMAASKLPDLGLSGHSGYSAQNAAMSTAAGGSGGFSGYGKTSDGDQPINYADWLPKGKNDPTRTIAGGNLQPMQIQSKEVNIWNRISDHIKSRCSLGLLRDCVP